MKQVASFISSEEAYMARAHLEGSGIPAYVRDENAVAMTGLSNAIGGVKVDVADEQYDAAVSLLATLSSTP